MNSKYYECEYCKNKFKKEAYLSKHQKNTKYCLSIQEKNKNSQDEREVEEFEPIKINIVSDLEKKRLNEIHESFLEFEDSKLKLENEYNTNISNILEKQDLKNNIDEYYSIEKNKINKLQNLYSLFEKNKLSIEEKYENLILEENKNWKEELKEEKIKELESNFDLIKNKINNLIDISEDIDDTQDILNQFIFNLNEHLNLNESETESEGEDKKLTYVEDNYIPNKDIENKLLYHLIVLLQDQKLNKDTLMYIIVELMKYINNFNIKGKEKKSYILYILRNFIDTNEDDIENKEDMKSFLTIFSNDFIDIISAISDKKIRIKLKTSCFFPLCF